jgi:AcrR family transcriptional regulator
MDKPDQATRAEVLRAALKHFAMRGYAGASVQDIIADAGFSKPTLYYYFKNKAGLFEALMEYAYDECYRLLQTAASRSGEIETQLVEIGADLFEFLRQKRDLTRIGFATAFAAPGELPDGVNTRAKGQRNFEFVHNLIKQAMARGKLDTHFSSLELAYGIYGAWCFHLMANLALRNTTLNRRTAERIARLFLGGAAAKSTSRRRTRK